MFSSVSDTSLRRTQASCVVSWLGSTLIGLSEAQEVAMTCRTMWKSSLQAPGVWSRLRGVYQLKAHWSRTAQRTPGLEKSGTSIEKAPDSPPSLDLSSLRLDRHPLLRAKAPSSVTSTRCLQGQPQVRGMGESR